MEESVEESSTVQEQPQRLLALEGSYNIRDIGGYATLDGRVTRWKTFLRADSPNELSQESQRLLLAYPVHTVIDLRRSSELRKRPNIFVDSSEVRYVNISLLEDESKVQKAHSFYELYCIILETCQEPIRQTLQLMATEDIFPCVFHCAIGKDRTGLITALLLSIANVSPQTIAADYALSEQNLAPLLAIWRERVLRNGEKPRQDREWIWQARAETMLDILAYLQEKYDGVKAYLRAIGLTDEQLDSLYSRLVV